MNLTISIQYIINYIIFLGDIEIEGITILNVEHI